jgi:hypothetical protein
MSNLNEQQFSGAPSLTTAKISGILRKAGVERYTRKAGSKSTLRDINRYHSETSGIEIEPEVREALIHRGSKTTRPSYQKQYSGRYAISYRKGYTRGMGQSKNDHTPEQVSDILSRARGAFTNSGLKISEHHREGHFWVHE